MSNQVTSREFITRKRDELALEIVRLQRKVDLYTELLAELPEEPKPKLVLVDRKSAEKLSTKRPYTVRALRPRERVEAVELALEAAGEKGITAKELAEVASVPVGTASGRLSLMKADGRATHIPPRYFAVHSKQEDNNSDQGMEQ